MIIAIVNASIKPIFQHNTPTTIYFEHLSTLNVTVNIAQSSYIVDRQNSIMIVVFIYAPINSIFQHNTLKHYHLRYCKYKITKY